MKTVVFVILFLLTGLTIFAQTEAEFEEKRYQFYFGGASKLIDSVSLARTDPNIPKSESEFLDQAIKYLRIALEYANTPQKRGTILDLLTENEDQLRDVLKAERDKAVRMAEEVRSKTSKNYQAKVLLLAAKARESTESERKMKFFGSAFRLDRDTLKSLLSQDPGLIEAAYQSLISDQENGCVRNCIDSKNPYSYLNASINDFVFAPDFSKMYITGEGNKTMVANLGKSDAISHPEMTEGWQSISGEQNADKNNVIALSPDGKWLATAGESGRLSLFENGVYKEALSKKLHSGKNIFDLVFIDNERLASVGGDSSFVVYNILDNYIEQNPKLNNIAFKIELLSLEGKKQVALATEKEIYFLREDSTHVKLDVESENILDIAWDANNKRLYVAIGTEKATTNDLIEIYKYNADETGGGFTSDKETEKYIPKGLTCMEWETGEGKEYLLLGFRNGQSQVWDSKSITKYSATAINFQQKDGQAVFQIGYYPEGRQVITSGRKYLEFHPIDPVLIYNYLEERYGKMPMSLREEVYKDYMSDK